MAKKTEKSLHNEILELELYRKELARRKLIHFTTYTWDSYIVNWHHEVLCHYLDRIVFDDSFKRLMIITPPRHGKSELVSVRLPAFFLGINPDKRIISTSYGESLVNKHSRLVKGVIDSQSFIDIFPETRLIRSKLEPKIESDVKGASTQIRFDINNRRGGYIGAGINGPITGEGADLLLIDDPIKNRKEAESVVYRNDCWDWYSSTAYTRLEGNGKVILVLTRWNEDDLAGRLLEKAKSDPAADQWTKVILPAVSEGEKPDYDDRDIGEPLWADKYDADDLDRIMHSMTEYDWLALYQGRPTSPKGNLFKRKWMNEKYLKLPDYSEFDAACLSWDFAFKDLASSSFVVGQAWAKKGANIFLLDEIREQMDFATSVEAFISFSAKYPWISAKLVEDKANGPAIMSLLKDKITGIIPVEPQGGKEARANFSTVLFMAGNIKIPRRERCPWIDPWIEEICSFPSGKYNDRVDAMTQALTYLTQEQTFEEIQW